MAWISSDAHFPPVQSKTLDGHAISLPAGMPGERTLLILGFQRSQQPSIEGWAKGMHLGNNQVPWLQLPVIDGRNAIVRAMVNGGMRHAINRSVWPHIVAVYTQKGSFERTVGIDSESAVNVLVVDRNGTIIERVTGDYTPEGCGPTAGSIQMNGAPIKLDESHS